MEIKRVTDYGISDDFPNELKVIREVRISADKNWTKMFLDLLVNKYHFQIKNYNCEGIRLNVYDYYMWCNVLDNGEDDLSYITLTYNTYNGIKGIIDTMSRLEDILIELESEFYIKNCSVNVMMTTIDKVIEDIKEAISYE